MKFGISVDSRWYVPPTLSLCGPLALRFRPLFDECATLGCEKKYPAAHEG